MIYQCQLWSTWWHYLDPQKYAQNQSNTSTFHPEHNPPVEYTSDNWQLSPGSCKPHLIGISSIRLIKQTNDFSFATLHHCTRRKENLESKRGEFLHVQWLPSLVMSHGHRNRSSSQTRIFRFTYMSTFMNVKWTKTKVEQTHTLWSIDYQEN